MHQVCVCVWVGVSKIRGRCDGMCCSMPASHTPGLQSASSSCASGLSPFAVVYTGQGSHASDPVNALYVSSGHVTQPLFVSCCPGGHTVRWHQQTH